MEQAIIDIILEPMDLNFACILLLSSISRVQTSFGDLDFFFNSLAMLTTALVIRICIRRTFFKGCFLKTLSIDTDTPRGCA